MTTAPPAAAEPLAALGPPDSPAVVELGEGDVAVEVGRDPAADVRLGENTVSKTHARLARENGRLVLEDLDSRFGTYVNGVSVVRKALAAGDRVRFGRILTYWVDGDRLRRDDGGGGVVVRAEGVAIARGGKRLCGDLTFTLMPDELVGLLGPSGAGKSTLLNCLAGFLAPARGRVGVEEIADAHAEVEKLHAVAAFVPQDDEGVMPTLTVRENLIAAARLRLGGAPGGTGETPAEAVARVLEAVGLDERADLPAGSLSGGQRKRLSVGFELLRRPRLLLLDEPTSGLDPATEAKLTERLRSIARKGTTVVCATHLMESLRLLDRVVVIGVKDGEGAPAYVGPPGGLLDHLDCTNHADLYEKLETGEFETFVPEEDPTVDGTRPGTDPSDQSTGGLGGTRLVVNDPRTASLIDQWKTLTVRSLTAFMRDRGLVIVTLAQPAGLAVLDVLSQVGNARVVPVLFFAVVIAVWLGLNASGRELVRERRQFVRERRAGLDASAYLLAKVAALGAVGAVQVTLLLLTLLVSGWALLTDSAWGQLTGGRVPGVVGLWLLLMVCNLCGTGLGLLVSALARSSASAVAVLPLLILPQLLVSAVGATKLEEVFFDNWTVPYRPLAEKLGSDEWLGPWQQVLDLLSMVCYSRPAAVLAFRPSYMDGRGPELVLDAAHLLILLLGTFAALWWAFRRGEERWLRLEDLP